jgi:hypothetical protein
LRDAFVAASVAWVLLLVVAPYLASRAHASTSSSALLFVVYGLGSLVCHQLPERSYHLWTAQMPVCARCAGIYLGALFGAVGARLIAASSDRPSRVDNGTSSGKPVTANIPPSGGGSAYAAGRLEQSLRHARVLLGVAVLPTALTLVYEWSTGDMPAHAIRAAAGLPIGLAVAWLVVAAAENQVN